jgi:hypothetical protein
MGVAMPNWLAIGLPLVGIFILWRMDPSLPTPPPPIDPAAEHRFEVARAVADATVKNDPTASLVWEDLYTNADATVVCAQFRVRNALGGMDRKRVSATGAETSESVDAWNKRCAGNGFFSEKYTVGLWTTE